MLSQPTSGLPGHPSTTSDTPLSPGDAARVAWTWLSVLIATGLPLPRMVDVSLDGAFANVSLPSAEDVQTWARVLGAGTPQVRSYISRGDPGERLTSTVVEAQIGAGTSVRVHHVIAEPLDDPTGATS
jgi:hypothetical protein